MIERGPGADGPWELLEIGEPEVRPVPHPPFTDTSGAPGREAHYRVAAAASVKDFDQPRSNVVTAIPTTAGTAGVDIAVDAATVIGPLDRPWRPMIGSEHLSQVEAGIGPGGRPIGAEFSEALRLAHDELGVEAVRAHAILGDDLGTYREVDGRPVHDFSGIDRVYDHVLGIGLRPIVELSFMPRDLASDPDKTVFEYGAIVSPPRDWDRWEELVRDLTAHLVNRYGRDEVRRWAFEVWNEANLDVFWSGTREEYLRLYDVSVRAVKSVDAALIVGGPASAAGKWVDELLAHCRATGSPIDFVSTHTYGNAPLDLRPIAARHGYPGPAAVVDRVGRARHATSTRSTTHRGAPPTSCAAWRPRWAAPRPSPTGRSPTTSRSSAGRRGSCTAASGCWRSGTCASRAGGASG